MPPKFELNKVVKEFRIRQHLAKQHQGYRMKKIRDDTWVNLQKDQGKLKFTIRSPTGIWLPIITHKSYLAHNLYDGRQHETPQRSRNQNS